MSERIKKKEWKNAGKAEHETSQHCSGGAAEMTALRASLPSVGELWTDAWMHAKESFVDTHDWKHNKRMSKIEEVTTYKGINSPLLRRYRDLQQKQKP